MYLPQEIPSARVLVTVKAYPLPSRSYGELVCTAGLLNGERWVRIYPVPFRILSDNQQYPKYSWIELDLKRKANDFRPESYMPRLGIEEEIFVGPKIGTKNAWAARKDYVLNEVFTSMNELIALAKGNQKKSLATLKPKEIVDFVIEDDEREWKQEWVDQLKQLNLFDTGDTPRHVVRKLPYKFSYRIITEGDDRPRKLMIEDWEIGALYWNSLNATNGDEEAAKQLVRRKFLDEFVQKKDLYLFLGTTLQYHNIAPNPLIIVGVFYPPKTAQPPLL